MDRKVVIPGEIIAEGEDLLPGEHTEKIDGKVISLRYGLAEEQNSLVKVIPLSGVYSPRRGNVVIGKIENLTNNGWVVDIGSADSAFLSLMEVPRYVNKDAMEEVFKIDELLIAKIWSIGKRGIDLSIKSRGYGKIEEGMVFSVNSNKVPRIIGKEGSMINIIKEKTGCEIDVAQNGYAWITGPSIDDELYAKKAINFVTEKSFIHGLTDEVTKWFDENKK
ncbi:hypothetical protein COT60_03835 [Candidatus Pacearchaeota archaeon CG09_land_8_20_14_0_10_30_9]|nr:MAG: hypothetical protein COT60_03835 [Candidatus Pacearchaeota archaeon CG09_land_8_20_14_0_10_30_9]